MTTKGHRVLSIYSTMTARERQSVWFTGFHEGRKIDPNLPILIASGYGGPGFETRALSAGVNRILKKPYRMSEIADVLAGFFAAKG